MYSTEVVLNLLKKINYQGKNLINDDSLLDLLVQEEKIIIVLDADEFDAAAYEDIKSLIVKHLLASLKINADSLKIIFSKEKKLKKEEYPT
ncbi:hypothetical protein [Candidatus Midichloria mitochondrii]|uniref:Uncharacterized protein n=1 Tax=Midichloria mitochondrii (strain IricVA) TaxID=696127 RepID=F7XWL6_MIDMI|nr:hypothetical protein [Candidatus Midichloria mitochondrii]AEI89065.1 hypothetical protein midi_00775 [Candidatus Midichloria mitochondrii IricVA]